MIDGTIRQLSEALTHPDERHTVLIAENASSEGLGFAYAALKPDYFTRELHGYLEEIVAIRDGEGIGAALLSAVEAWAFGRGSRYVELSVLDRNANAIAFYERSGYEIDVRKMVEAQGRRKRGTPAASGAASDRERACRRRVRSADRRSGPRRRPKRQW